MVNYLCVKERSKRRGFSRRFFFGVRWPGAAFEAARRAPTKPHFTIEAATLLLRIRAYGVVHRHKNQYLIRFPSCPQSRQEEQAPPGTLRIPRRKDRPVGLSFESTSFKDCDPAPIPNLSQ